MKGFNVKKLAAIATGAVLLGTAIAPIVSATDVTKDDIYNANGTPKVNIVVGSEAALSDAVWAGNLAAKIAEKAATTKTVSVSGNAGTGSGSAELDLSDLTVDVTVGGTVSFGAGSKEYKVSLDSSSGIEVNNANDTNVMTDAQLPHLYNASLAQKVDNNSTTPTITERMGVKVNAKFDTSSDITDLVAYMEGGDFYYESVLGTGGIDLGTTSFTDGSNDNVKVVFFGEEYELSAATLTGNTNIRMVKASSKESYNEGETVKGLVGAGELDEQSVTVKVVQIIQTGAATTTYSGTFELYDEEENLIDIQTVASDGTPNLKEYFQDSDGDYALKSNLYINTVAVGSTTEVGYVELTKGTDTIELYNTKGYPYDPTDTSGIYDYTVSLTVSGNSLDKIKIQNSRDKWNNSSSTNGPLYPTNAGDSLTGMEGTTAEFGQSLMDDALGKGYAKVEFLGWEGKEEVTTVEFGTAVSGLDDSAEGGLKFRGADDADHVIPFALELDDTDTGDTFVFDGKTIWYDLNYGTNADSTNTNDLNFAVTTADTINGRVWTVVNTPTSDTNAQITVAGVGIILGSNADANLLLGDVFNVDGVTYTYTDTNASATAKIGLSVDGAMQFRKENSSGTLLYNNGSTLTAQEGYGLMFFTQDRVIDGNASGVNLELQGSQDRGVLYAVNPATTLNRLWLMLDADTIGMDESNVIQNNKVINFLGTTMPNDASYTEKKGIGLDFKNGAGSGLSGSSFTRTDGTSTQFGHYVPQDPDYNSAVAYSNGNAYFVANFVVDDAVSNGDFNVYIDTADGQALGPFNNSNLTGYSSDADFNGTPTLTLTSGTGSNYYTAAYTDAGSKAWLLDSDAGVKISMPENAEKVQIVVYGAETTREVSGGETLTLAVGESGTTDSGSKVTVEAVAGGSCGAVEGGEAGTCKATPETYATPADISKPLVYLDVDNPSGPNVIVGGHIVNSLAASLEDELTAPGDKVARIDATTGDIYVAGYTASDTGSAVQELINDIDAMDLA